MDKKQDMELKDKFKNSKCLQYAGEVVEVPVVGWMDGEGRVHFYNKEDEIKYCSGGKPLKKL